MIARKLTRCGLTAILGFALLTFAPMSPAKADVTVTAADPACNQTVGNAIGVTARRLTGGDCLVTFTDTSTTTWTVPTGVPLAKILVVGGGGGGGGKFTGNTNSYAGGGGAGGVYEASNYPLTSDAKISVTVGAGGVAGQSGASQPPLVGRTGSSTSFGPLSAGGGGGGGYDPTYVYLNALDGTAGGGGGGSSNYWYAGTYGAGASGITLTVGSQTYTARPGGNGAPWTTKNSATGDAGPGGGASAAPVSGVAGAGVTSSITDTSTVYGTGGRARVSGVTWTFAPTGLIPGNGGDGWDGSTEANAVSAGGNGANGIVIIRYVPNFHSFSPVTGTLTYRQVSGLTFTATLAGKVTFLANGKRIPRCISLSAIAGNSYTVTCSYKPSIHGKVVVTTNFTPTNNQYASTSKSNTYLITARTGTR